MRRLLALSVAVGAFASAQTVNYYDLAERAGQLYGLPPKIMSALVWQESRANPYAVSSAGAIGLAQLMPATARALEVNPHDPWENVLGGAKYLRQQWDRFGSWPLALAAYNAGPGNVLTYGGIPPFKETVDYVEKVLGRYFALAPATAAPAPGTARPATPRPVQATPRPAPATPRPAAVTAPLPAAPQPQVVAPKPPVRPPSSPAPLPANPSPPVAARPAAPTPQAPVNTGTPARGWSMQFVTAPAGATPNRGPGLTMIPGGF
ncbi:lytic transglycosylase domain-containing protein [Deinococcus petrolearius]|uniref:Lytic transglycosylase domain-containing protein n=1 Tax=Deinococcus petrolearius TaxID=1751295 RepID=A0ABW1DLD8_9DEIO